MTMKLIPSTVSLLALGAAGLLTSCVVDPYYPGSSTTTVTHYRPGYVVSTLPSGYYTETYGGTNYYRHNDVYYRRQGSRYIVVERPVSRDRDHHDRFDRRDRGQWDDDRRGPRRETTTVIRTLPSGARVVTYRGTRYYESRGTYYQTAPGGYITVRSPY